jgi:Fur family ferric uptake transcriptional regulator
MEKSTVKNWVKEIKHTKPRERVYSLLEKADKPLSANEIFSVLLHDKKSGACLSTIYRVLDAFVKKKIIVKSAIMGGETVYELNRHKHKHYAVCMGCRKMVELQDCPIDTFAPALLSEGFKITGHNIEIHGYCKACVSANWN